MGTLYGLLPSVVDSINQVFRQYPKIERAIIYGSRAKGNYKIGSDIDLTLIAPDLSLSELLAIENEIDDLMLPYKLDLSSMDSIENNELIDHIKRVGKPFYVKGP